MKKYIVYCTTCTINGKIYIGVHGTETPEKFDRYIGNGIYVGYSLKNPTTAFQHALKKYGYNNFKRSTLYEYDLEKDAYTKEAEIVNLDFIKRRDNYNTSLGGRKSGIVYDSLFRYSLSGEYIEEYPSVESAVKKFNCNSNRFNMAIKDKRSAFNSYWSKIYYTKLDVSEYRTSCHSEIYQYDMEGNLIKVFDSIKQIITEEGLTKASIEDATSHKRPLKGYYYISGDINIIDLIKTRQDVYNITDKSISKYSDRKRVQTYPSLAEAARENNITTTDIKKSMKANEQIWSYGYSEIYQEQYIPVSTKVEQYDLDGNLIKTWDSISKCNKEFPKMKEVMCGSRSHTHGYTFKYKMS